MRCAVSHLHAPSSPCRRIEPTCFLYLVSASNPDSYIFGASDDSTVISNGAVESQSMTFMAAVPGPSIWAMLLIGFESEVGTFRTCRSSRRMSVVDERTKLRRGPRSEFGPFADLGCRTQVISLHLLELLGQYSEAAHGAHIDPDSTFGASSWREISQSAFGPLADAPKGDRP